MQFGEGKPTRCVLQRQHPLAQGLVGAWAMDDGAGKNVRDHAGTNHGTAVADGKWVPGMSGGKAMEFNGSSDYVSVVDNNEFDPAAGTYSFWFTPGVTYDSGLAEFDAIIGRRVDGGNFCLVGINTNGKLWWIFWQGVEKFDLESTQAAWVAGTWYHIATRWGVNGNKIFVNGVGEASDSDTTAVSLASNTLLGNHSVAVPRPFNGLLDDIRIYNRALSAAEIAAIYRDPNAIYRPPRVQWFVAALPPAERRLLPVNASFVVRH